MSNSCQIGYSAGTLKDKKDSCSCSVDLEKVVQCFFKDGDTSTKYTCGKKHEDDRQPMFISAVQSFENKFR